MVTFNPKWFNRESFKSMSKLELKKQYGNGIYPTYEQAEAFWKTIHPEKEKPETVKKEKE